MKYQLFAVIAASAFLSGPAFAEGKWQQKAQAYRAAHSAPLPGGGTTTAGPNGGAAVTQDGVTVAAGVGGGLAVGVEGQAVAAAGPDGKLFYAQPGVAVFPNGVVVWCPPQSPTCLAYDKEGNVGQIPKP